MASVFDGLATALNSVFGEAVSLTNGLGGTMTVQADFREGPVEIEAADGRPMQIVTPSLRVRRDLAPGIGRDWIVAPASVSPRTFRVLRPWPSGSPAADAFIICELEEIE
jgi:hypothetical protein